MRSVMHRVGLLQSSDPGSVPPGSLHPISLSCPSWTFPIATDCSLKCWRLTHFLSDPLKKKKKKLGSGLSAPVLCRRCWDYSLVRSPLGVSSLTGSEGRDVVFLPLTITHTHSREVIRLITFICFCSSWGNLLFTYVSKWLKEEQQKTSTRH